MNKPIHERIPSHQNHLDDPVWWEPEIRAATPVVIELPGGLLAVDETDGWLQFTVFEFSSGPATRDGVEVEPARLSRLFHGEGSSGLRELRHTYWGEPDNAGYIFYPNAKLITAAFDALKRWFDCD